MSEAMSAEFDTVAEWTAEAAIRLGPQYFVPAGCRGSGSPAALDWLVEHLGLAAGELLLDCGAGVGGPAAYASEQRSVQPVLVEPEAGACRAGRRLFGSTVIQASATALPFPDAAFDAAWSLGVLCTVSDQLALLTELRRAVRPPGRIGLLVFVSVSSTLLEKPEGNNFPTTEVLTDLIAQAGLRIEARQQLSDVDPPPSQWRRRADAVEAELREQHGHERGWQLAEHQSDLVSRLLDSGAVRGELLSLRSR
jgi:ubiquinone/menaquinone biosynthesis C-methylase UbiE